MVTDGKSISNRRLRPDEEFVIRKLTASFGPEASWLPGENPPDCYLKIGKDVIAVEISTLSQHVIDDHGESVPRRSQDMTAVKICNELDVEIKHLVPKGTTVFLLLEAPVKKARRFKGELSNLIKTSIQSAQNIVEREILANRVKIQIIKNEISSGKRVIGMVTNLRSSPLILENAKQALDKRIRAKAEKCRSLDFTGPVWLALFNDYWLAGADTFKQAIEASDVVHSFERIYLVDDSGKAVPIYQKHQC